MQPIDALKKKIEKESLSVSKISKDTGIDAHKLYKWVQGKASPKNEDVIIIQAYLAGTLENVKRKELPSNILTEMSEKLLRIDAQLEVFESAIAGLLSENKNDFSKKVGELRSAVQDAVNRRFSELKKQ